MPVFGPDLLDMAGRVLAAAHARELRLATAETCTAGLVSACLTAVPGASAVFERGFVLYYESAKATGLGVPERVSLSHGAVSAEVTAALAEGALRQSGAGAAVAVTGYAGPGGGSARDPVGTVYVAARRRDGPAVAARHVFAGDRDAVRLAAVGAALEALLGALSEDAR